MSISSEGTVGGSFTATLLCTDSLTRRASVWFQLNAARNRAEQRGETPQEEEDTFWVTEAKCWGAKPARTSEQRRGKAGVVARLHLREAHRSMKIKDTVGTKTEEHWNRNPEETLAHCYTHSSGLAIIRPSLLYVP